MKRLLLLFVLAVLTGLGAVSSAPAGVGMADEPCPTVSGENTNTCPAGTVGEPYSIRFREAEGSGCGPGLQTFAVDSGSFPPGLVLESSGQVSGIPTQAGTFTFYVRINEPVGYADWCQGSQSEKRFTIPINPAIPRLTIGPESTSPATTGTQYSLQMTATVPEPKTWSISSGTLPPGLGMNSSTGLISGTPTTAGSFAFQVLAKMTSDSRTDTKWLTITVRQPLAIKVTKPLGPTSATLVWEVGVPFAAKMSASGGSGTYTWTIAEGALPVGLALSADGTIVGKPSQAGATKAKIRAADTEGRTLDYAVTFGVAQRLAISTVVLKPGRVGRFYSARVVATGGVNPVSWNLKGTKPPRGILFDPVRGRLAGIPLKAGTYRLVFEATDVFGVKATRTLRLVVAP